MSKQLRFRPYIDQWERWPEKGKVILAQFDQESVVVYQAYSKGIATYAIDHQGFGGKAFSFERMSWIKPNFLWMMHRSGWATKSDQTHILAIWLQRSAFDHILSQAIHSTYVEELYGSKEAWQDAIQDSDVRVQWDPDHDPLGNKEERRAIQLGMRGDTLRQFASEWILQIEDITPFVKEQSEFKEEPEFLFTPTEKVYPVADQVVAARLGITSM